MSLSVVVVAGEDVDVDVVPSLLIDPYALMVLGGTCSLRFTYLLATSNLTPPLLEPSAQGNLSINPVESLLGKVSAIPLCISESRYIDYPATSRACRNRCLLERIEVSIQAQSRTSCYLSEVPQRRM